MQDKNILINSMSNLIKYKTFNSAIYQLVAKINNKCLLVYHEKISIKLFPIYKIPCKVYIHLARTSHNNCKIVDLAALQQPISDRQIL